MLVGAAWTSAFARSGFDRLRYRRLRYAYRAPSFFLHGMLDAGLDIAQLDFDEGLHPSKLVAGRVGELTILYVSTHGMQSGHGFELALHRADWAIAGSGFGRTGPVVAVFDACNLVDLRSPNWQTMWQQSGVGVGLRLVLGFATPASVGERSSVRGKAFAQELLSGRPVASAWCAAIQNSSYPGTDQAIALAFGDDLADAEAVLDRATLFNLPGPRSATNPTIACMQ